MKRFLFILSFALVTSSPLFAQVDSTGDEGNERLADKMTEYIQKRLDLSKEESSKFAPIFVKYFKEWRQTLRQNRGDKLVLQQKVVELRLRYRPQFREIIGERRGDQVFNHQDRFVAELKDILRERRQNNRGPAGKPLRRNN
jgi:hypothetical protein